MPALIRGRKSRRRGGPRRQRAAGGRRPEAGSTEILRAVARLAPFALQAFKGAVALVNAEVKHVDVVQNTLAADSSGALLLLSGVAQGDTNITRDGNSIKSVGFFGQALVFAHASATASTVRLIVLVDLQNQGAAPTISDIATVDQYTIGLPNIDSRPNRFALLYDKSLEVIPATEKSRITFDLNLTTQLNGVHFLYSGTGATVASCQGPTLYLLYWSNEPTNTPTLRFTSRLFFLDN